MFQYAAGRYYAKRLGAEMVMAVDTVQKAVSYGFPRPFLLSFLPWDMRWVAKASLFQQPLSGWAMRFGGDIPLQRGEGESVL